MSFTHLAVICSILVCVSAKSLTLVIDTTYSMEDEIRVIRTKIKPLVEFTHNTSNIENYVIVPFNDPDVGPVQIFTSPEPFLKSIDNLSVSGGDDIPENSLSGLEKALQESKPGSDIFLFTDACAKDEAKFIDIQRLCSITQSKVIVFMSGSCPQKNGVGNLGTYYQVTKVCFGNVFQLDQNNYEQAFRFMKEIVRDGYNDVHTYELFTDYRQISFPVDSLTRDVVVSVSGNLPYVRLFDESGHSPRTDTLIETRQLQVVKIVGPHRGQYQASVSCQGLMSVTIYTRSECPLAIGFSPLYPRSIEETTSAPLPGRESFIFVLVPKSYEYKLGTLTIHMLNKDSQRTVNLMESEVSARVYISKAYFEPRCIFKMTVSGIDKDSSDPVRIISNTFESQKEVTMASWSAAVIDSIIPESSLTDYNKNTTAACKVTGNPQPNIWWEDGNGQKMTAVDSLLQYPATYISYVSVPNIKQNQTLTCKASTDTGSDSRATQLFVHRPYVFQMTKIPEDITIEYEAQGKLNCEVNAYPEAQIKWYHNGKTIKFNTNEPSDDENFNGNDELEYFLEDNALVIRNMISKYVGTYTCDVRNGANAVSYPVQVRISGLGRESFIFVLVPKSYEYKLGTLTIHMLNKDSQRTVNLMESEVSARVYISKAYFEPRCIFKMTVSGIDKDSSDPVRIISNTFESQKEVTMASWSAAVIDSIIPESSLTDYNKNTTAACKVTGNPQPNIWWEDGNGQKMTAVDSLLQYPATYISYVSVPNIKQNQTLTCKASTDTGSDSRATQLFVHRPYVFQMTKIPEDITIEYEAQGKLNCEVNAYPEAQIKWYHNGKTIKFNTNEPSDDENFNGNDELEYFLEDNALVIRNMISKYVGTYTCDVRNGANAVSYPVQVRISGLEAPILEVSKTEFTARLRDKVEIDCRISNGRPKPTLTWKFKPADGYDFIDLPKDIEVEEGKISICEARSEHNGIYQCEAVNEKGQDSKEMTLRVIYAPKIENAETITKEVLLDNMVTLECSVDAEPKATVRWERSDGVYFPDEKHIVEGNTLKFEARHNDSGSYRCVADNEAGTAEKTVDVNVLVRPYITPMVKTVNVRAGSPLTLTCHVQEANPPPTITWNFTAPDNTMTTLFRGESMFSAEHVIPLATRAQSGTYLCFVENRVGWDYVDITVNVK